MRSTFGPDDYHLLCINSSSDGYSLAENNPYKVSENLYDILVEPIHYIDLCILYFAFICVQKTGVLKEGETCFLNTDDLNQVYAYFEQEVTSPNMIALLIL